MSLPQLIMTVLRHWLVAGLMLVATAVAGLYFVSRVEPEYEAIGSVVLLPPSTALVQSGQDEVVLNPYSQFGNPQAILSTAIVTIMENGPMQARLEAAGVDGEYDVSADPGSGGAIMNLTVTTEEPRAALEQLAILMATLQDEVVERQVSSGAPQRTWINAAVLSTPDEPTAQFGSRTRVLAAVVAVGGVGIVAVALLSEALLVHRRRREEVEEQPSEEVQIRRLVLKRRQSAEPQPIESVGG
jgi:uncharacterized protein involved in exopolysaccharide biosynthesis